MKIIPAINCIDYKTALSQIKLVHSFLKADYQWIHIDIVDGEFAPNTTWGSPKELRELTAQFRNINFEIHLMVKNPEDVVEDWLASRARRLIIHVESDGDPEKIRKLAGKRNTETALAGGREVSAKELFEKGKNFDIFQVLAVNPGLAGQKFDNSAEQKIRELRALAPNAQIEIDGGMNFETIKLAKSAGADIAVSASTIFNSENPKEAYEGLVRTE